MTRLIKLIMVVAILAVVSAVHAQIFDETYDGATTNKPAYVASEGIEWVANTGLNISNSAAVFNYTGVADVTNTLVELTVVPVLNDVIPTDVEGAAVVFWVGSNSNVYRLVTGDTAVENDTVNVISGATEGAVAFEARINYIAKTYSLKANGTSIFSDVDFYSNTPEKLASVEIRETSAKDKAVFKLLKVQELDKSGNPTAADSAAIKVYEKGGKVYVELEVETDGVSTSFDIHRDGELVGTITYVDGQAVYTIEDANAVVGQTYNYIVTDFENGTPVGDFDADITVLPVLEAKSFEMTKTHMTIKFASVPGETYKVVGLTSLIGGTSSLVEDNIVADSFETSILIEIGDNFYFQIIKK